MRVLIIGGTSFMGPHVVARLLERGHTVTLLHRGEHEAAGSDGAWHIHADRAQIGEHRTEIAAAAPDVALDMCAMFERHAQSAVRALRGIARRLVVVSSVDVYRAYGWLHGSEPGLPEPMLLTEDSPLREKLYPYRGEMGGGPMDDYDKILVERAAAADAALPATIVRLPAVHGERDPQRRLRAELARMDAGRPAILVPAGAMGWRWARGYAGNIADAIALAVEEERAAGRVYHVAEPEPQTQEEWLRDVGRVAGWDGEIVPVADERLPQHLRLPLDYRQDLLVDSTRIRAELGYAERVSHDEGIARAIAWERGQPRGSEERIRAEFAAEDEAMAARG